MSINQQERYKEFWNWFIFKAEAFYEVVSEGRYIQEEFFSELRPELDKVRAGIYYLTGMKDESTAELILTPETL